jgi:hypothetical protein
LREYVAKFNDTTIKVINPNQEVFVGAFQNGLMVGQFNESPAHKPADSMDGIIARSECYIKGEESNAEKKVMLHQGTQRSVLQNTKHQQTGIENLIKSKKGDLMHLIITGHVMTSLH